MLSHIETSVTPKPTYPALIRQDTTYPWNTDSGRYTCGWADPNGITGVEEEERQTSNQYTDVGVICLAGAIVCLARIQRYGYDWLSRCDMLCRAYWQGLRLARQGMHWLILPFAWGDDLLGKGYEFLCGNNDLIGRMIWSVGALVCLAGAMICLA